MKYLYHSYPQAVSYFKSLEEIYPEYIRVNTIGKTWEKRDILQITLSNNIETADEKPALFYTGTIHAREYIGLELAISFAQYVVEGMDYDPRIKEVFEKSTMYLVPCANPDGLEYSRDHFSFWRKNRRQNADGSIGVDLNRNFPIGFKPMNTPSANVYPGPHPFSEPETQAIRDFVESHENITIALDYHSQGNVFFPAHDFRHEHTIDTTDMNVLCANMAQRINKVSGREYGIHQGKPPANLISGSGREFYYSKGIIGTVVEVGTQNISDYMDIMSEHVSENIPALLAAMKSVPNYAKDNPLKRPEALQIADVDGAEVTLTWTYGTLDEDVYFEIYRSKKYKSPCNRANLLAVTRSLSFTDITSHYSELYYYRVRAVNRVTDRKSPFAPHIRVRTEPGRDEFTKTIYPIAAETGYLGEKIVNNKSHFGLNSLFTGINAGKGHCVSLLSFSLSTMPENAVIKSAKINLYPINRVGATVEKFGEWAVSLVDTSSISSIYDYPSVKDAPKVIRIGKPTKSQQLTQGIWRSFEFSLEACHLLEKELLKDKVLFRIDGPDELPAWRDSQMMQWDLGYGKFGYGLEFRPQLEVVYTMPSHTLSLSPQRIFSCSRVDDYPEQLISGFEDNGKRIIGYVDFDLSGLPDVSKNVIVDAYIELERKSSRGKSDVRYHIEMIEPIAENTYDELKNSVALQRIAHDASLLELQKQKTHGFPCDAFTIGSLEEFWVNKNRASFAIIATSSRRIEKSNRIEWEYVKGAVTPKLVLNFINKRRHPVEKATDLAISTQNNMLKLSWTNPMDDDFRGVVVVKNPFRVPVSPYDGQKIYGGKDNYTFDKFGAQDICKYYAVFAYDHVPNYSEPVVVQFQPSNPTPCSEKSETEV